jgi:propanediol dehydratase small subunit
MENCEPNFRKRKQKFKLRDYLRRDRLATRAGATPLAISFERHAEVAVVINERP